MATTSLVDGGTPVARHRSGLAQLLLLRPAPVPAAAPVWVLPVLALTTVVFLVGLLQALGRGAGDLDLSLSGSLVALLLVSGVVGRLVAVVVQAEAGVLLAGAGARERSRRRVVLVACLLAQLPTALRDLVLGVLGLSGVVSTGLLLQLLASPFDPFLLWSCVMFVVAIRSSGQDWPATVRRGLYVGFIGYAYALKLVLFALGSLATSA